MTVVVTLSHRLLSLIRFMGFLQVSIDEINVVSIMLKHLIRVEIECLSRIIGRREGSATVKVSCGVEIPRCGDPAGSRLSKYRFQPCFVIHFKVDSRGSLKVIQLLNYQ